MSCAFIVNHPTVPSSCYCHDTSLPDLPTAVEDLYVVVDECPTSVVEPSALDNSPFAHSYVGHSTQTTNASLLACNEPIHHINPTHVDLSLTISSSNDNPSQLVYHNSSSTHAPTNISLCSIAACEY